MFITPDQIELLVLAATLIGFNYGTNLSVFPSATKDYFGLKNFGVNYGLVFSAWGVGGFIFPRVSQMIIAHTNSPRIAYILAALLLLLGSVLALMTKSPAAAIEETPEFLAVAADKISPRLAPAAEKIMVIRR